MIKSLKTSASEVRAQNFYVWTIKQTTGVSKKTAAPKRQLDKILGLARGPISDNYGSETIIISIYINKAYQN